ncbi:hypothetical protein Lal_00038516 [Lupinus albus]|nr:hypothetical protein Lal_00038516 [Lupinus albus]
MVTWVISLFTLRSLGEFSSSPEDSESVASWSGMSLLEDNQNNYLVSSVMVRSKAVEQPRTVKKECKTKAKGTILGSRDEQT